MTSKQKMRVVHNSVGCWLIINTRTITSCITRQLFNALVTGSPEFAKSSNQVPFATSYVYRQKDLNKTNQTDTLTSQHISSSSFRLSFNTWPKYRNSETKLSAQPARIKFGKSSVTYLVLLFGLKVMQTVILVLHSISSSVHHVFSTWISACIAYHKGANRTMSLA